LSARGSPELSIIVPVFNERETVEEAIGEICNVRLPVNGKEVVIVDDGSTDGTRELLMEGEWSSLARVVAHDRNQGKGAAIRTGLREVQGTYTTIMDADREYDPASIGELLPPLYEGVAEAVYGVRGFQSHSSYSYWYVVGNNLVTLSANLLYNRYLADIMTCHKIMRTDLFRLLPLKENGFAIEAEITARLLRRGAQIYEVPIDYNARTREEGKKLTSLDGIRVLRTLLRCRFT
jgi:glycosyltransferase involved in cell wall biosynthesis